MQFSTLYYHFNVTAVAHIFTNTCILQFIQQLYNILGAFGIPQWVFVKNLCTLGSVFFEGLRMTQWRSKHVALSIYYFNVYEINCCVLDWHICAFYITRILPLVLRIRVVLWSTRVGTLIVATIYLQPIQNRYMFRRFTVLQCSHQHCVQPVASDVEVVGYL